MINKIFRSKYNLILIGILILGAFLRFYRLIPNLILNGEMGTDYMNVWNIIHGTRTFLIGPRTSHEWFFIPPISYWIYAALLFLGKYSPVVINIFWAAVGSLSIPVCYYYVKKLFSEKVSLISSFLLAVSPAWVWLSRDARYNAPAAIIFFPYLWYLLKSIKDKGRSLGILGLILGVSMSFFPNPFLLIPAAVVCFIYYKVRPKLKYILYFLLGFLIPNITFVLYEISNKFAITIQILTWIPYRILGFLGFYPKNTASSQVLSVNFTGLYTFFQQSWLYQNNWLIFVLFAAVLIYIVVARRSRNLNILLIVALVSYLGLFLHGAPPQHYYLIIFPVPLILLALFLEGIAKKYWWLSLLILAGLFYFNLRYYFSPSWFFPDTTRVSDDRNFIPFSIQEKVADYIAGDAGSQSFSVGRVGPLDYFEENFSLNYQYLLTIRGKDIKKDAKLKYTIYEDTSALPDKGVIHWIANMAVVKTYEQ